MANGRMAPIEGLFDKRIIFVTGKGGVGKTTVSLALGIAAAARGRRTIVCEVASQESLSRSLGRTAIGFEETAVRQKLFAISIDPDRATREYLELQLPVKAMSDLLYRSKLFTYLAAATPGLSEMVTVGKIWELAQPERRAEGGTPYDLVIVDAPATGHGVGLLQTPQSFAEIARVGPLAHQAGTIGKTITDPETTVALIVATPEEMPVNETAQLESELIDRVGVRVAGIYLNSVLGNRFSGEEMKRIGQAMMEAEPPDSSLRAALGVALDAGGRARSQTEQLERLRSMVRSEIRALPHLFAPELGELELERLAEAL
jgi:anion-transporting  ArsA/GET3 family ATPase